MLTSWLPMDCFSTRFIGVTLECLYWQMIERLCFVSSDAGSAAVLPAANIAPTLEPYDEMTTNAKTLVSL
eukprot:scaffold251209_cov19-Prasinocladus_malaysianus.AAC.1